MQHHGIEREQQSNNHNLRDQQYGVDDLIIESLVLDKSIYALGEAFNATITVKNQGSAATGTGFVVYSYRDKPATVSCGATYNFSQSLPALAAGMSATFSISNNTTVGNAMGNFVFRAFADGTCTVAESNENNNQATFGYTVVGVGSIIPSRAVVMGGVYATFTVLTNPSSVNWPASQPSFTLTGPDGVAWTGASGTVTGAATIVVGGGSTLGEATLTVSCGSSSNVATINNIQLALTEIGLDSVAAGGTVSMKKRSGQTGSMTWLTDPFIDNGTTTIMNPIWKNQDHDWQVEQNDPVCYIRGATPHLVGVKLYYNASSLTPSLPILLRADATPMGALGGELGPPSVIFGPSPTITISGTLADSTITLGSLTANGTVGGVVNNYTLSITWKMSTDGGITWQPFQTPSPHPVFVTDAAPQGTYCSNIMRPTPSQYEWSSLSATARRMNWATTAGAGTFGSGLSLSARVANYLHGDPKFRASTFSSNPFYQLQKFPIGF